jgi:Cu+-exporting ATPase
LDDKLDESTVLRLVGAAEHNSEHVLGKAIVSHVKRVLGASVLPPADSFVTGAGMGIVCTVEGHRVAVGNRLWMDKQNVSLEGQRAAGAGSHAELMDRMEMEGKTVAAVAVDGTLAAFVGLADKPKPEAAQVVAVLKRRGIRVYMLTGDNERTARMVANTLGIRHVFAQVLPSHKADKIKELQGAGKVVAMVGDGINDAPALACAELGVAVGTGTDVAVEAAQVVLIKDNLMDVAVAIHLSHATVRRIHANFVWAVIYNAIGIPLAAGVLYPVGVMLTPVMASLAMAFSSVSVVASSLLLKRYKKPSFALAEDLDARPSWSTRCVHHLGRLLAMVGMADKGSQRRAGPYRPLVSQMDESDGDGSDLV